MMVSNFVLPITPSAAVTHAFNARMRGEPTDELILVRSGYLQMHLYDDDDMFHCYQSIKLKGNVKDACLFRPPNSEKDVILVLTNETSITAYAYDLGRMYVAGCGTAGNILQCGTEIFSHQGKFIITHPNGIIVARIRSYVFTVILWNDLIQNHTYAILDCKDVRSTDAVIKQMEFLHSDDEEKYEIAYIKEEDYGRHLCFFSLDIKLRRLTPIGFNIHLCDDVTCIVPLEQPYGGVLLKMNDRFLHFTLRGLASELVLNDRKFATVISYARISNKERFVFCDYLGQLYLISIGLGKAESCIRMTGYRLGSVKAAYRMCIVDERFIFFGNKFNDSVMAYLNRGSFEKVIQEYQLFPHFGGISHLSIVDDGKHKCLLGLNTNDEPTLRLNKKINHFRVHYTVEENPQNAMFSFPPESTLRNHVLSSFGKKSVLLEYSLNERSIGECSFIEKNLTTLAAGTFRDSLYNYQVTTKEIRVFHPDRGMITWDPNGAHIDFACVNEDTNQILLSSRSEAFSLVLKNKHGIFKISLRKSVLFNAEITCLDLGYDSTRSRVFAAGFWSTKECNIYQLSSMQKVASYKLSESFPRSIAVGNYHERYYAFCGTADGRFLYGTVNFRTGNFDDVHEMDVGLQPVLLLRPDRRNPQYVYVLSDRTMSINDDNGTVNFVEHDMTQLTAFCYLLADGKRLCAITSSELGTQVGFVDDSPAFEIREIKINHNPYDMCYEPNNKHVGLLCRKKNYVRRTMIVNPDVEDTMETYEVCCPREAPDLNAIKTYFVTLYGKDFSKQDEIELEDAEYASCVAYGKFSSDPVDYFLVGTVQFENELGQTYNDLKMAIDREKEKWLMNRVLIIAIEPNSEKTVRIASTSWSHGMIRNLGILGNTVIAAMQHKLVALKFNGNGPMPLSYVAEYNIDGPLVMQIRGNQILITEQRKAIVVAYDEPSQTFRLVTRDERCHRITAAEFVTDDFLIGADKYNELIWGRTGYDGCFSTRAFAHRKSCYVRERVGALAVGNLHTERAYSLNRLKNPVLYTTWRGGIGVIAEAPALTLKLLRDLIEMLSVTRTPYVALERSNTGLFITNRFLEGNFLKTFLNWQNDQLMEILENYNVPKERLANCYRLLQDVKILIADLEKFY